DKSVDEFLYVSEKGICYFGDSLYTYIDNELSSVDNYNFRTSEHFFIYNKQLHNATIFIKFNEQLYVSIKNISTNIIMYNNYIPIKCPFNSFSFDIGKVSYIDINDNVICFSF